MINKTYAIVSFCMLGIIVLLSVAGYNYIHQPLIQSRSQLYYFVKPGSTIKDLANFLHEQHRLTLPMVFIGYGKLTGAAQQLKAGEYQFTGPLSIAQLLQQVKNGKVIQRQLTFVEGWTFKQLRASLEQAKGINNDLAGLTAAQIIEHLQLKEQSLEGLFFPDTYSYTYGTKASTLLKQSHSQLTKILSELWQHRANNLSFTSAYEALIVASLIEKETAYEPEKPLISAVIQNRIRKNMYLQIDPTVVYALGESYQGKLYRRQLRIPSLYNTYRHKGLPPSPIAIPSLSSMQAALHPATNQNLYFVAKGDGSHVFTTNLKAHHQAVKKFLRKPLQPSAKRSTITN